MPVRIHALASLFIPTMDIESCYKIGFVVKTHGLKGEVTAFLDADTPEDLSAAASVFLELEGRLVPFFIQSISRHGDKAFLKLEEIESIDQASTLVKKSLYLAKSSRPKSGRGEFYNDEIIHFTVVDKTHGALGSVSEIMDAGPNRLLVVHRDGKEVLIPVNSPFISSLNKGKRMITVDLPEGFLDI